MSTIKAYKTKNSAHYYDDNYRPEEECMQREANDAWVLAHRQIEQCGIDADVVADVLQKYIRIKEKVTHGMQHCTYHESIFIHAMIRLARERLACLTTSVFSVGNSLARACSTTTRTSKMRRRFSSSTTRLMLSTGAPRRIFISEKEPRKKVKNRGRNSRPSIKQVVEERELTDDLIEKLTDNNEFREMQEDYVAYALRLKRSWLTSAMNTVNLPTFDEMLTGFIDPPVWWLRVHMLAT